jgi:hypothetical protein
MAIPFPAVSGREIGLSRRSLGTAHEEGTIIDAKHISAGGVEDLGKLLNGEIAAPKGLAGIARKNALPIPPCRSLGSSRIEEVKDRVGVCINEVEVGDALQVHSLIKLAEGAGFAEAVPLLGGSKELFGGEAKRINALWGAHDGAKKTPLQPFRNGKKRAPNFG